MGEDLNGKGRWLCPLDGAALLRDIIALSTWKGGEKKIPKQSMFHFDLLAHRDQSVIQHAVVTTQTNMEHMQGCALYLGMFAHYWTHRTTMNEGQLSLDANLHATTLTLQRSVKLVSPPPANSLNSQTVNQTASHDKKESASHLGPPWYLSLRNIPWASTRDWCLWSWNSDMVTQLCFWVYAPTLVSPDDEKEAFCTNLNNAISAVPYKHQLFILGDFMARIGCVFTTWS